MSPSAIGMLGHKNYHTYSFQRVPAHASPPVLTTARQVVVPPSTTHRQSYPSIPVTGNPAEPTRQGDNTDRPAGRQLTASPSSGETTTRRDATRGTEGPEDDTQARTTTDRSSLLGRRTRRLRLPPVRRRRRRPGRRQRVRRTIASPGSAGHSDRGGASDGGGGAAGGTATGSGGTSGFGGTAGAGGGSPGVAGNNAGGSGAGGTSLAGAGGNGAASGTVGTGGTASLGGRGGNSSGCRWNLRHGRPRWRDRWINRRGGPRWRDCWSNRHWRARRWRSGSRGRRREHWPGRPRWRRWLRRGCRICWRRKWLWWSGSDRRRRRIRLGMRRTLLDDRLLRRWRVQEPYHDEQGANAYGHSRSGLSLIPVHRDVCFTLKWT